MGRETSILGPGKEREYGLVERGHALVKGSSAFGPLGKLLNVPETPDQKRKD